MKEPKLQYYNIHQDVVAFSSTREGGYSEGLYGEFNINRYCGDRQEAIQQNRDALCQLLKIDDSHLLMPHQVHLTEIGVIDEAFMELSDSNRQEKLEGIDALMINLPGVCIGVSTADCIPILLYDQKQHASCAIHAGWRGTVGRIGVQTLQAMQEAYGTKADDVSCVVGPSIGPEAFEVGEEVYETFAEAGFPMDDIAYRHPATQKWHIDLWQANVWQLMQAGVQENAIQVSGVCTYMNHARFFSARRLGINSGRMFTGIMINEQ
jgi:YfiH family protein